VIESDWQIDYLGLRHLHGGRGRGGLDCWGLAVLIYREQRGIELPVFDGKDVNFDTQFVRVHTPKEFDLAFYDGFPARSHVGVVLSPPRWMIHVDPSVGVTCVNCDTRGKERPEYYRWTAE